MLVMQYAMILAVRYKERSGGVNGKVDRKTYDGGWVEESEKKDGGDEEGDETKM